MKRTGIILSLFIAGCAGTMQGGAQLGKAKAQPTATPGPRLTLTVEGVNLDHASLTLLPGGQPEPGSAAALHAAASNALAAGDTENARRLEAAARDKEDHR